ncbi:helix-turn-helix domain-containing protein [Microbacteriaceae bacterium 4G12]
MYTLGKRIRSLRKENGLTQTELAGNELTKSMLSQIETGRAMPSMKTLTYIAQKLDCEPSYFLDDDETTELSILVREIETSLKEKKYEEIYEKLKPIATSKLPMTVDAARLLEQFALASMHLDREDALEIINRAMSIYEKHSLYRESAKAKLLLRIQLFKQKKFQEMLQLIYDTRDYYEEKQVRQDVLFELTMFYFEAIALLALGAYEEGKNVLLKAIEFSKEHETYYKADEFYRITAYQAMLYGDQNAYLCFMEKARQYAVFTESTYSLALVELTDAVYHNTMTQQYNKALLHIEKYKELGHAKDEMYYNETGKALFGLGHIEKALTAFQKVSIPEDLYHPIDHSLLLSSGAYRALCYKQLGMKDQALIEAEEAYKSIKVLPKSQQFDFVTKTLLSLYEADGQIEKAQTLQRELGIK